MPRFRYYAAAIFLRHCWLSLLYYAITPDATLVSPCRHFLLPTIAFATLFAAFADTPDADAMLPCYAIFDGAALRHAATLLILMTLTTRSSRRTTRQRSRSLLLPLIWLRHDAATLLMARRLRLRAVVIFRCAAPCLRCCFRCYITPLAAMPRASATYYAISPMLLILSSSSLHVPPPIRAITPFSLDDADCCCR